MIIRIIFNHLYCMYRHTSDVRFCILIEIFIINEVFCINGKRRRTKVLLCIFMEQHTGCSSKAPFHNLNRDMWVRTVYPQSNTPQWKTSQRKSNCYHGIVSAYYSCILLLSCKKTALLSSMIILQVCWVGRTTYFTLLYCVMRDLCVIILLCYKIYCRQQILILMKFVCVNYSIYYILFLAQYFNSHVYGYNSCEFTEILTARYDKSGFWTLVSFQLLPQRITLLQNK